MSYGLAKSVRLKTLVWREKELLLDNCLACSANLKMLWAESENDQRMKVVSL